MLRCAFALLSAALLAPAPAAGQGEIERSVVRIVSHAQPVDRYSPWNRAPTGPVAGSGFVVAGGRVMTNAHIVSDSRMCLFFLHGDPTPHPARVSAVGHDCDLALLTPEEPGLLDAVPTAEFGGLPAMRSTVETYGYPAGGRRLSSTRGVVSRVEIRSYVHSGIDAHLTVQTDAAINPGNSGGPVVQDGKVVGVAFQATTHLDNVGYFIPTEVVAHFLTDARDGVYDGYPDLGALTANLENPAARRRAGMEPSETGVAVFHVFPGSSADGLLREGDVLLEVEDHPVANDGTVSVDGMRLDHGILADRKQVGEELPLRVLRGSERLQVRVPMHGYPPHRRYANAYDELPRYYVYAGLVFTPLDRGVLETFGGQWAARADRNLLYEFLFRRFDEPGRLAEEPVVLLRTLDHPVNASLAWRKNRVVDRVNGRAVGRLEDAIEAFEAQRERFHVVEFADGGRLIALDRERADLAHPEILERYGVPGDRRL